MIEPEVQSTDPRYWPITSFLFVGVVSCADHSDFEPNLRSDRCLPGRLSLTESAFLDG